jgi:hypothetical protein
MSISNHDLTLPTLSDQLTDLKASAEKGKIRLTPEIERLLLEGAEKVQAKVLAHEKLTKADLAFIQEAKGMMEVERFRQIELPAQYGKRLETLKTFDFIKNKENPVIVGIDGKKYPVPTLEQIMPRITPEKAKLIETHIKSPILLVVPFAMPLKIIAEKAGQKKGKLDQNPVYTQNYDIDSDLPDREGKEQLVYFPEKYDKAAHGGFTKSEVLASSATGAFPGWQVLITDGAETVPKDTLNKSAIALKAEFYDLGLSGLTPEEWLLLHAEGALKGVPFDDYSKDSYCCNLAAFLKKVGRVPGSYWNPEFSQARLYWGRPGDSGGDLGSRRVVRIY